MKKITILIISFTSCISQKYTDYKPQVQKPQVQKPQTRKKTDYETDIMRFGYPNDVSTYRSEGYYSKTCTWYNANGKYRSYDYNEFGKRTSTFETNSIK